MSTQNRFHANLTSEINAATTSTGSESASEIECPHLLDASGTKIKDLHEELAFLNTATTTALQRLLQEKVYVKKIYDKFYFIYIISTETHHFITISSLGCLQQCCAEGPLQMSYN